MLNSLAINELFEKLFKQFLTEINRKKGRRMKGVREEIQGRMKRRTERGRRGRKRGRKTDRIKVGSRNLPYFSYFSFPLCRRNTLMLKRHCKMQP